MNTTASALMGLVLAAVVARAANPADTVSGTLTLQTAPEAATVLIDRDGRVRYLHRGYREGMEEAYERQIRELVKE